MKANVGKILLPAIAGCVLTLEARRNAFGFGGEYSNGTTVHQPSWPIGMSSLANSTNRVAGHFVNAQDIFFYSGTAADLNGFLADYSRIQPIEKHRLVLHSGKGETSSLGGKYKRLCDWKLTGCPRSWLTAGQQTPQTFTNNSYVLEVHFWIGGRIPVRDLVIPKNVELAGDCFTNFTSITKGMTRAEVEQRLESDGGLQSVSPVRFIDTNCPGFKVSVEFESQRDAADQNRATRRSTDKVIRVSAPYLEPAFVD